MPVRYDQDTKDDHRKENHGWLPHGTGGALQRGMEWVMHTAAGLLSGAPRPTSIPDAIRAAPRPLLIIAGGASADEPVAARWFQAASPSTVQVRVVPHAGHTQGLATAAPGLGSPRDQLPERGPEPGHHASRPGRRAQRLARQPEPAAGGGEDDLGPESFYLVSGRLARMPSSASGRTTW